MYRKRIPLYYSSERIQRKLDFDNFGDLLSGEVVKFVSGRNCKWASPKRNRFKRPVLFAIGSIIRKSKGKCVVWGSGIKFPDDKIHPDTTIYAVRGKYTLDAAIAQGCKLATPKIPLGDPAILSPLIYNYPVEKVYEYGVVPHFVDYPLWEDMELPPYFKLIDVKEPPENVIAEIRKCKHIFSSSLHGMIVGHSFNIPSLWVKFSNRERTIGNIKYNDYFSSMGIAEYEPLHMTEIPMDFPQVIASYFDEYKKFSLHAVDLTKMQEDLIKAFPAQYKR